MERRPEVPEQRVPSSSLEWPSRDGTRRSQFTIIAGPNGAGKSHTHKVVDNPPLWFREQFEKEFGKL